MARVIGEVRPRFVFVENSPLLVSRGLDVVLSDLAALGYDAAWGIVAAADAIWLGGIPEIDHLRDRIWIGGARAHADGERQLQPEGAFADFRRRAGDIRAAFPEVFSGESANAHSGD